MYEASLEFPEGWGGGGLRKNPFRTGGMDIFWNYTMIQGYAQRHFYTLFIDMRKNKQIECGLALSVL